MSDVQDMLATTRAVRGDRIADVLMINVHVAVLSTMSRDPRLQVLLADLWRRVIDVAGLTDGEYEEIQRMKTSIMSRLRAREGER